METSETISGIISSAGSGRVLKISRLAGKGLVNEVFIVKTENSKLIVRINEVSYLDEYEKEVWAVSRAKEKKIPAPEILKVGIFGEKAYSIQKFIEGSEGRDSIIEENYIWEKLGSYASRIHQIKVAGFGLQYRDLIEGNTQKSWRKYLDYNIESLNENDELRKFGVLTDIQSEKVRNIFENLRERKFEFGLNHGDLSLKNTIVDPSGTIHLIDWGSSEASMVPHHDLIQLMKMKMLESNPGDAAFRAFLDGYGISRKGFETMLPDLKSLSILRAFDKLRWAIDRKIANLGDYIFQAKETVKQFL